MTSLFKKTSIAFLMSMGLLSAACGDDSNSSGGGEADAGGNGNGNGAEDGGNGGEADAAVECKGGYAGFTEMQINENLKTPAGACGNAVDVAGVCAKDPSTQAREVGLACFLAFGANKPDEIRSCTLDGTDSSDGLKKLLAPMSEDCLSCYVDSVLCAVQNCSSPCAADAAGEECNDCRIEFKCTETFYTCSGLPTSDELAAAK